MERRTESSEIRSATEKIVKEMILLQTNPAGLNCEEGAATKLHEFLLRFTTDLLEQAKVYAEHASRTGDSSTGVNILEEDVVLAIKHLQQKNKKVSQKDLDDFAKSKAKTKLPVPGPTLNIQLGDISNSRPNKHLVPVSKPADQRGSGGDMMLEEITTKKLKKDDSSYS
mmetsp:Transcript_14475/g.16650  ORF Transcript_14475/g.16650 Transcript_14475/m.16650 type:complete len:169 (+) Transcript_14475:38-544(+)